MREVSPLGVVAVVADPRGGGRGLPLRLNLASSAGTRLGPARRWLSPPRRPGGSHSAPMGHSQWQAAVWGGSHCGGRLPRGAGSSSPREVCGFPVNSPLGRGAGVRGLEGALP